MDVSEPVGILRAGAADGEHARPDLQDAVTVAILGRELAGAGAGER